jgi:hypothetical protein
MTRRHLLAAAIWLASGLGTAACLGPTLPTPPPEAPDAIGLSQDEGFWDIRGSCTPGAKVLVKNLQTGAISGREDADNDGRYLIRMEADLCDHAQVSEVVGNTSSDATFFIIQPVENGLPDGSCE